MTKTRSTTRFTEARVRKTTARPGRRVELTDPTYPGLILRVSRDKRNGRLARVWLFRHRRRRVDGDRLKRGGTTLGVYPESRNPRAHPVLDVQQAIRAWKVESGRELDEVGLAEEIRRTKERLKELLKRAGQDITFRRLYESYMDYKADKVKRPEFIRASIENHIPADWFDRPVAEIERDEIANLVYELAQERPMSGNKLLERLNPLFKYGITRGWIPENPVTGIAKPARERKRTRVLSAEEIGLVWTILELHRARGERGERSISAPIIDAVQFLLCVGQRGGEVYSAKWTEIRGEHWVIPPENIKTVEDEDGEAHEVFLGPLARAILQRRQRVQRSSPWIFESPRTPDQPVTNTSVIQTVSRLSRRLAAKDLIQKPFTPHDLRRTMSTHLVQHCDTRLIVVKSMINHKLVTDGATANYIHPQLQSACREGWLAWDAALQGYIQAARPRETDAARFVRESTASGRRRGRPPRGVPAS